MEFTHNEARAHRLGYPAGVCGYSPDERFYWVEPALGWVNPLLNPQAHGLDPDACARELATLYYLPQVWNENMAPRFNMGTCLAGRPLAPGEAVSLGDVLLWFAPGDAPDCPTLARVVGVEADLLRLACDNGGRAYRLPWGKGAALGAFLVTHYISQPLHKYE